MVMEKENLVRSKLNYLSNLNEVDARHYVGLWAIELGWGGISKVNKLTRKSMDTIRKGIIEINSGENIKKRRKTQEKWWWKKENCKQKSRHPERY